jgi:hypothetical protein
MYLELVAVFLTKLFRPVWGGILLLLLGLLLSPLAAQPPGIGDNCCHLPGRNCQSDHEWIQGYYEFAFWQCQPPQAQSDASQQGSSSGGGQPRAQSNSFSHSGASGAGGGLPNQDAEEEPTIDPIPRTIATPRPSFVREILDAAQEGQLETETPEQEAMSPMRRCSSSSKTLWRLYNCAGAS